MNLNILKKLFCTHEYKYTHQHFIEVGMGKVKYLKCIKCGKIKKKIIRRQIAENR